MPLPTVLTLLPVALLLFVGSLVVVMLTAAWFTRRLEALCEMFGLSIGILSLLSALGANIPNYAASVVAIVEGRTGEGISIIIGSNIYNIAVILASARWPPGKPPGLRSICKRRRMRAGSPGLRFPSC